MAGVGETMLSSGHKMPMVGFGTALDPAHPSELLESTVLAAIELGYRHFDTASLYQTEAPLSLAISEAIRRGLVASRDELFITTKILPDDLHPDLVLPALRKSLRDLGLEYVDLYLIHFPARLNPTENHDDVRGKDLLPVDMKGTWQAMEECSKLGLAKSIGVSNFSCKKLSQILACATIPPAVNQVEMHPFWQQGKLREFCAKNGVHVIAYSPLGKGEKGVMESEEIKQIAEAKGKSIAQICLRWALEQGVSFVTKSSKKERLKESMQIFEWQLSNEELLKMSNLLPQQRIFTGDYLVSPDGLYKSVSDLWDGEI